MSSTPDSETTGPVASVVASIQLPARGEHCVTIDAGNAACLQHALNDVLVDLNAAPLQEFVFGGCRHYPAYEGALASADMPTTWIQGDACRSGEMLSLQALAVSGITTIPIHLDGKLVGQWYEDAYARYCHLGGILPSNPDASRAHQTHEVLERMTRALRLCGMVFADTVRTWFYLDRLLAWYDTFNQVRTTFFEEHGVFDRLVPASTGIGACNPFGCALAGGLVAVKPREGGASVCEVASPLQCSARSYRSSFSRAVEVACPTHRTLYVSGTASIDPDGHTQHVGDARAQVRRTMEVVDALLASRAMGWDDVVRGVAYFKDIRADRSLYDHYCTEQGIRPFPLAWSHADVCRDDLLFEIEVDAVQPVVFA
jgi:enamine deaminase RidA (YjgF/YER057c/UK114 family)